jgi:hypothetical protein
MPGYPSMNGGTMDDHVALLWFALKADGVDDRSQLLAEFRRRQSRHS